MKLHFSKYHGAGNDFVMVDGRTLERPFLEDEIAYLCHRYFGVGADGLIIIDESDAYDFEMHYFNSDGSSGMMCANGSRCAIAFAKAIGYKFDVAQFSCCDIQYSGKLYDLKEAGTYFPNLIVGSETEEGYFIDTGAPHLVLFKDNFIGLDPRIDGHRLRYHELFAPGGCNVNFVQEVDRHHFEIVTYERGVEDLTLACGTGALAAAIAYADKNEENGKLELNLESDGGLLIIKFHRTENDITEIEVVGPVKHIFSAEIQVQKLSAS